MKPKKQQLLCAFLIKKGFLPRTTDAEKEGESGQSVVDRDSGDNVDQNNTKIIENYGRSQKNSPTDGDDGSSSRSSTSGTSSSSASAAIVIAIVILQIVIEISLKVKNIRFNQSLQSFGDNRNR